MFVDHEKYMAFDVEKKDKLCVCGKEADSQEFGFCEECLTKRNEFIEQIVGSIELDGEIDNIMIEPFEALRKRTISDRIGFIYDTYLSEVGVSPVGDVKFTVRCLHDKTDLLADLVRDLELYTYANEKDISVVSYKRRFVNNAYTSYLEALRTMYISDWDLIKGLNSYNEQTPQEQVNKLVKTTKEGLSN